MIINRALNNKVGISHEYVTLYPLTFCYCLDWFFRLPTYLYFYFAARLIDFWKCTGLWLLTIWAQALKKIDWTFGTLCGMAEKKYWAKDSWLWAGLTHNLGSSIQQEVERAGDWLTCPGSTCRRLSSATNCLTSRVGCSLSEVKSRRKLFILICWVLK